MDEKLRETLRALGSGEEVIRAQAMQARLLAQYTREAGVIAETAQNLRMLYTELMTVGFTEQQALSIVGGAASVAKG